MLDLCCFLLTVRATVTTFLHRVIKIPSVSCLQVEGHCAPLLLLLPFDKPDLMFAHTQTGDRV